MTPEEQRIAIAEWCGWYENKCNDGFDRWSHPEKHNLSIGVLFSALPDYLNDLNAMHEAEKNMYVEDKIVYVPRLREVVFRTTKELVGTPEFYPVHATAAQRAEALLRTIRKWEEKK